MREADSVQEYCRSARMDVIVEGRRHLGGQSPSILYDAATAVLLLRPGAAACSSRCRRCLVRSRRVPSSALPPVSDGVAASRGFESRPSRPLRRCQFHSTAARLPCSGPAFERRHKGVEVIPRRTSQSRCYTGTDLVGFERSWDLQPHSGRRQRVDITRAWRIPTERPRKGATIRRCP